MATAFCCATSARSLASEYQVMAARAITSPAVNATLKTRPISRRVRKGIANTMSKTSVGTMNTGTNGLEKRFRNSKTPTRNHSGRAAL